MCSSLKVVLLEDYRELQGKRTPAGCGDVAARRGRPKSDSGETARDDGEARVMLPDDIGIEQAHTILRFAPEMVDQVLARNGTSPCFKLGRTGHADHFRAVIVNRFPSIAETLGQRHGSQ